MCSPHIAFVIPSLSIGGAEKSLCLLANALASHGYKISIVCFRNEGLLRDMLKPCVDFHGCGNRSSSDPLLWIKLRSLFGTINPDVLFGWSTYANMVVSIVSRMVKQRHRVILSERNYPPEMFARGNPRRNIENRVTLALIKMLYKKADMITANSLKNIKFMKKYVGSGPGYKYLPNIIDVAHVQKAGSEEVDDLPRYSMKPRLLAVARLEYQKGIDTLILAMARIREERDWCVRIIGDGPERRRLEAMVVQHGLVGTVRFLGERKNPYPYYAWADIIVVPSRFEGFPNVILEGMATKCAVVATDCDTGPREIIESGVSGVLVPVDDPPALASAILRLGNNPQVREQLAEQGYVTIVKKHSSEAVGRYAAACIKDIVSSAG